MRGEGAWWSAGLIYFCCTSGGNIGAGQVWAYDPAAETLTLVVDRGAPARVGDIVVAIVDNQFTVKYLAQDGRGFFLKPGNIAYPPIRPEGQLEIYGVVTGSFRRY